MLPARALRARSPTGGEVGAGEELPVTPDADGVLLITIPDGGPYAVDLWGRGEEGDAACTFVVTGAG